MSVVRAEFDAKWVAEQIRLHRLQQNDVAQVLGINASGVTRLLQGQRRLRDDEAGLLRDFFARFKADQPKNVPPRLLSVLSMRDVELSDLSRRTEIPASRLLEIKYGDGLSADLQERTLIGRAFGLDPEYLFAPTPLPGGAAKAIRAFWKGSRRPVPQLERNGDAAQLPVYRPRAGLDGFAYGADLELVERRESPAQLRSVVGAYGLYITVRTFEPLVLPGDIAWVHPGKPLAGGTRAIVWEGDHLTFGWFVEVGKNVHFVAAEENPGTDFGRIIELASIRRAEAIAVIESR